MEANAQLQVQVAFTLERAPAPIHKEAEGDPELV
jgi:hypothetical protein